MFLGKPVCFEVFATLLGVGKHGRLGRLRQAVMDGATAPPMDMRLVQARSAHAQPSAQWAEVFSYLTGLYESVAETMPDDSKSLLLEHADGAEHNINTAGDTGPAPLQDLRFLPPGSIFEQWRQFVEVIQPCSFKLFWTVWRREFPRLLAFRQANAQCVPNTGCSSESSPVTLAGGCGNVCCTTVISLPSTVTGSPTGRFGPARGCASG